MAGNVGEVERRTDGNYTFWAARVIDINNEWTNLGRYGSKASAEKAVKEEMKRLKI